MKSSALALLCLSAGLIATTISVRELRVDIARIQCLTPYNGLQPGIFIEEGWGPFTTYVCRDK